MHTSQWPWEQTRGLVLEHLRSEPKGSFHALVSGAVNIAIVKGLYPAFNGWSSGALTIDRLPGQDRVNVAELVRQIFWGLVVQGVLVPGMDENNPGVEWYRLTGYGEDVVQNTAPQPHDPDGYLAHFDSENPNADLVVRQYLDEALRTYNANCPKASAVMLGAASEKLVLLLHDVFENAIADPAKKTTFQNSYRWTISSKYTALKQGLDHMVQQKTFSPWSADYPEVINNDLAGVFQMLRRLRNTAGHPELLQAIERDKLFLNLRVFSEYAKSLTTTLIGYFKSNPAVPS